LIGIAFEPGRQAMASSSGQHIRHHSELSVSVSSESMFPLLKAPAFGVMTPALAIRWSVRLARFPFSTLSLAV
jgi:hypothetical protein